MTSLAEPRSGFTDACRLVEALAEALQTYGVSSRSMIVALSRVAKALGVQGEFLATPNYVHTVVWEKDGDPQRVHLAVVRSGDYDLAKLSRVIDLATQVETGSLGSHEALERLGEIVRASGEYGPLLNGAAFVIAGLAFAGILGASWLDAMVGAAVAVVSFAITLLAARSAGIAALQEVLVAAIAAVLGNVAAALVPGVNPMAVAVCAAIVFVPGFGLTIAPRELLDGNTLSGIIWLTNALVVALKLMAGAAVGVALAHGAGITVPSVPPGKGIPSVVTWVAVPALILALAVLMRVERRQFPLLLVGGWLAWAAVQLGSPLGVWQGTFLGAMVLVIYANWSASHYHVPSVVVLLPCVMILVPGLAALRALHAASTLGALAGFRGASDVMLIIAAIIGGAIVGEALTLHNLAKTGKVMRSLLDPSGWIGRRS